MIGLAVRTCVRQVPQTPPTLMGNLRDWHPALLIEAGRNYLPEISGRRSEANDLATSADMLFRQRFRDQAERSRSASATCRAMPVPSTSSLKSYLGLCSDTRSPGFA